jgi:hypothetical protein
MSAMIFEQYLDESEEVQAGIFAVGGFVGTEDAWDELEGKWVAALPQGITTSTRQIAFAVANSSHHARALIFQNALLSWTG